MTVRAGLFFLGLLAAVTSLHAQTLYKYLDKDGKVVYSDRPSKHGPSTKIEVDPGVNPIRNPVRAPQPPAEKPKASPGVSMEARVALRGKLRAAVDAAEARLVTAKQMLEEGRDPRDNEWQPTMSGPDNGGKPNAAGVITGRGGRVACSKVKAPDGSDRIVCPALMVPTEGYHERVKQLEDEVERAEAVLLAAQLDYRRNAPD